MTELAINIGPEAEALARRLADTAGLKTAIGREMDAQNDLTIGHISTARMRGNNNKPFPVSDHKLGIRSAKLVQSIHATKSVATGDGVQSSIGSNIKYAGIHEFGGTIKRVLLAGSVRLRTDRAGNLLRQGKNGKLAVFARKSHKRFTTASFSGGKRFETVIPARAPFRHGIQDRLDETGKAVGGAIIRFLSPAGGAP